AVASAAEMRSALRAAGRLRTSVGPIRLRMSIGVHSGSVDLFLVGGDRRQLIVGGGAATAVVTMEAAADAGEILLSPDTAGRLGASAQGALKGPGVLLARPPKPPIGPVAPQRSGVDVSACVAPVVRAALERGDPDGEHRWLTIGFAHLAGVDNIIAADGPDYTAAILDQVARELAATVARHELWDLDCDLYHGGPKFIVVGGAPAAHENDAERVL